MNKKGCILGTALLLGTSMGFAADDMSTQSNADTNATTTTTTDTGTADTKSSTDMNASDTKSSTDVNASDTKSSTDMNASDTKSSTDMNASDTKSSTDTDTSGTKSSTGTDTSVTTPSNSEGIQTGTHTSTNASTTNVDVTNVDVNANVSEVNNKVIINGVTAVPTFTNVELRDNVYYIPETVVPVAGFYFLTVDSVERVCSLKKITKVKVLSTPTTTKIMIGKKKHVLYCYDKTYFNF